MELAYFEEVGFDDVKISVKASTVPVMIEAYRLASETFDHPLHLGVTEAGPPPAGLIKGTAGIGTLLAEGIGDTIRYSLTADPVARGPGRPSAARGARAARAQRASTSSPARRAAGPRSTSSTSPAGPKRPSSRGRGRCRWRSWAVSSTVRARRARPTSASPPGATRDTLFIKGKIVRVVPEDEMVEALIAEAEKLVAEGVEARLRGCGRRGRTRGRGGPQGPLRGQGRGRQPVGRAHRDDPQDDRPRAGAPAPKRRVAAPGTP